MKEKKKAHLCFQGLFWTVTLTVVVSGTIDVLSWKTGDFGVRYLGFPNMVLKNKADVLFLTIPRAGQAQLGDSSVVLIWGYSRECATTKQADFACLSACQSWKWQVLEKEHVYLSDSQPWRWETHIYYETSRRLIYISA